MHIFLTGNIQVGKSTVIARFVKKHGLDVGGFRTYWRHEPEGRTLYLAPYMGGEGVCVARGEQGKVLPFSGAFDASCGLLKTDKPVIVMDELGVLERNEKLWQAAILRALDSGANVIGVIKPKKSEFLDKVRSRKDVMIIPVDKYNRDAVLEWLDTAFEAVR